METGQTAQFNLLLPVESLLKGFILVSFYRAVHMHLKMLGECVLYWLY